MLTRTVLLVGLAGVSGCHLVFPHGPSSTDLAPSADQRRDVKDARRDALRSDLARDAPAHLKDSTLPPAKDAEPVKKDAGTPAFDLPAPQKDVAPPKKDTAPPKKDAAAVSKDGPPKPDLGAPEKDKSVVKLDSCGCIGPCCSSCQPKPIFATCVYGAGYPGQCDGSGKCNECRAEGDQCGSGDPTPCCAPLVCDTVSGIYETCQVK